MPKGIIKCRVCNWETEGSLPEGQVVGQPFVRTDSNTVKELDITLFKKIQKHHL